MDNKPILTHFEFVDLTHPLDEHAPTWNGSCGFRSEIKMDYDQGLRVQAYKCHAGVGTHMDAPSHFIRDAKNIGDIPLEVLIVPCSVLNLSSQRSEDLIVTSKEIIQFEKKFGKIAPGSLFFAYTGWAAFWSKPDQYRNLDQSGQMHFPTMSKDAAELLLERDVAGVGMDTLSPDPQGSQFPVHHLILGKGKYILENVANLNLMPPVGAYAINLPLNIRFGAESPVRLVGLIPKGDC
ncbi:MAG: cyclase family protein [Verrucomicrobia bacterium]|nr:cyclase family protein [Verrucomicrobiota bacterium]